MKKIKRFFDQLKRSYFYSNNLSKLSELSALAPLSVSTLSLVLSSGCTAQIKSSFLGVPFSNSNPVAFTQTWNFDPSQISSYAFNPSKIDFTGGVCRLTGTNQTDNSNATTGFGGGTLSGAAWDATNGYVRLNQIGTPINTAELDSSWAPKWSSLISYWTLNNNWNDSKGPYPGTAQSGATFSSSSKVGSGAAVFDGSVNGVTSTGNIPQINGISKFTMSVWLYPTSFGNGASPPNPLGKGSTNNDRFALWFANGTSQAGFFLTNGGVGGYGLTAVGAFSLSAWSHWVLVYDGTQAVNSNRVKLYINGALQIFTSLSTMPATLPATSDPFQMGWAGYDGKYTGLMDDVAIWSDALSPTEAQIIYSRQASKYSGTFTSRVMDAFQTGMSWTTFSWVPTLPFLKGLPDYSGSAIQNETSTDYPSLVGSTGSTTDNNLMSGIVGLWHLDETALNTVTGGYDIQDRSGAGNHGYLSGLLSSLSQNGIFGTSILTDDTQNGGVKIPGSASTHPTAAISISSWVNPSDFASALQPIVNAKESGGYTLSLNDTTYCAANVFCFVVRIGGSYMAASFATTGLDPRKWYHLTGTFDGSAIKIYLNGILKASTAVSGPISYSFPLNPVCLGTEAGQTNCWNSVNNFHGLIDEVAIWNRALDPKEILQLYRRGANRIKHQVRICTAADCSDDATGANWKGPDGTNQTYFSELNNNTVANAMTGAVKKGLPWMLFSDFTSPVGNSRYFQYRTILESDDNGTGCDYGSGPTWCSPELKSVTVDPVHYDSSSPTVIGHTGVAFKSISSFLETLGFSCASGVNYNLGVGSVYSNATWYYWNGSAWAVANGTAAQSNAAAVIATNAPSFGSTVGTGTVYFKAFLKSSGSSNCELGNLDIGGMN